MMMTMLGIGIEFILSITDKNYEFITAVGDS